MREETMTPRRRIETAINLQVPDRVPVVVFADFFAARYTNLPMEDFVFNPEKRRRAIEETFRALGGWDAVFMASTIDPIAFSWIMPLKMKLPGRELPPDSPWQFDESREWIVVDDYDAIIDKGWDRFWAEFVHRILDVDPEEALERLDQSLKDVVADVRRWEELGVSVLISVVTDCPFETLSHGRSLPEFTLDLYRRPEKVISAMDAMVDDVIAMGIKGATAVGVPIIFLGGLRANLLSAEQFDHLYFPWMKRIVEAWDEAGFRTLLHLDQDWTRHLPRFKELPKGRCILHLDGFTDIFKAKEILGDHMCVKGDVPPTLLTLGTPSEVEAYCQKLIDMVGAGGGFILSQGCDVPIDAKPENVRAMIDTGKSYQLSRN